MHSMDSHTTRTDAPCVSWRRCVRPAGLDPPPARTATAGRRCGRQPCAGAAQLAHGTVCAGSKTARMFKRHMHTLVAKLSTHRLSCSRQGRSLFLSGLSQNPQFVLVAHVHPSQYLQASLAQTLNINRPHAVENIHSEQQPMLALCLKC
jgi:hypothetical protein